MPRDIETSSHARDQNDGEGQSPSQGQVPKEESGGHFSFDFEDWAERGFPRVDEGIETDAEALLMTESFLISALEKKWDRRSKGRLWSRVAGEFNRLRKTHPEVYETVLAKLDLDRKLY